MAKVVAAICIYQDWEFIEATVNSLSLSIDRIIIFEGAWQTAIDSGASPRSDEKTQQAIQRCLKHPNVQLVQINKGSETEQRQYILEYCRDTGADFCWSVDADEIFPLYAIENIKEEIDLIFKTGEYMGIKLCSYNFFGNLTKYYHGEYPRIYRLTPGASVAYTNHVHWPDIGRGSENYKILNDHKFKFFHLSYLRKNTDLFHIKMKFLHKEFGNDLYHCGYGEKDGVYEIPVNDFAEYSGDYPEAILNHPYYPTWTQTDF